MDHEIPRGQPDAQSSDIEAESAQGHCVTRPQQGKPPIMTETVRYDSLDFYAAQDIGHGPNVKDAKQYRGLTTAQWPPM
jgi:hypothetical protein